MDDDSWASGLAEALCSPQDVAQWCAEAAPSAHVVELVALLEPTSLGRDGQLDVVVALENVKAWLDARQQRFLAALAIGPAPVLPPGKAGKQFEREEVALATGTSFPYAASRMTVASELVTRLPDTLALQERAVISPVHARSLAEAVRSLDDEVTAQVEQRVLTRAPEQTVTLFRRSIGRAVKSLDPASVAEKRARREADRCVRIRPAEDDMSVLSGLLPAEGAAALTTLLDSLADQAKSAQPDDGRTRDQLRADVLTQLVADRLTGRCTCHNNPTLPAEQGLAPSVRVTVALSTLLGVDDQPGELAGYGPIGADLARRIAADQTGTWQRLLTDDHGTLVEVGTVKYRPPKDLREHVIARDGVCRFPGCTRPARRTDIDHLNPHGKGGATCRENCQCLCERHHQLKHETDWTVTGNPEGDTTWVSPTGRRYKSKPADHPIDHTADAIAGEPEVDDPPF